jgi:hypothetical protein
MTVKAGDADATLLRIHHTSSLIMSMERDVELADAVRYTDPRLLGFFILCCLSVCLQHS